MYSLPPIDTVCWSTTMLLTSWSTYRQRKLMILKYIIITRPLQAPTKRKKRCELNSNSLKEGHLVYFTSEEMRDRCSRTHDYLKGQNIWEPDGRRHLGNLREERRRTELRWRRRLSEDEAGYCEIGSWPNNNDIYLIQIHDTNDYTKH